MIRKNALIILIFLFTYILSCSSNLPSTFGKARQIVLLTNYKPYIETQIKEILEQNIYTVQPEPEFIIEYQPLLNARPFLKFRFIFIVGTLDEEPINSLVYQQHEKIEKDTLGLFALSNVWADNQKVLIFVAQYHEQLAKGLNRYSKRIRKTFQNYLLDYMTKITYERGYNKNLTKELSQKHYFSIKAPYDFRLNKKYEKDNFIYLNAHNPDRSIFFYSQPTTKELVPFKLIELRDSLTKLFYEGDFVLKEYTRAETTDFNGIFAIKLLGVWQNNKLVAGGPFIAYCFNYDNRFYFIDGMVYYPGKKKLNSLNQIDAILHTFRH